MFKKSVLCVLLAVGIFYVYKMLKSTDYPGTIQENDHQEVEENSETFYLFTETELKQYNGIQKPFLYLSILGNVFDVTKGSQHYGPGQSYNFFIGRDASKAFITGKLGNNNDVLGLATSELQSLNNWLKFYTKTYTKKGILIGEYYDENGSLTSYGKKVQYNIERSEIAKQEGEFVKSKFPPCNLEWNAEKGTRVWCTNKSGGVERNWAGKPRQFFEPGSQTYRCACIKNDDEQLLGSIREYKNCDKNSDSCFVNNKD